MHRVFSYLMVSLVGLSACYTPIEIDVDRDGSLLVINSLYTPDSVWTFHLSQLVHPLDTGLPQPVIDAEISILANGQPVALQVQTEEEGFVYKTDYLPQLGVDYTVTISAPGFAEANATTRLDEWGNISAPTISDDFVETFFFGERSYHYPGQISISDPPRLGEGYNLQLQFYGEFYDQWEDETLPVDWYLAWMSSEELTNFNLFSLSTNGILLSDFGFNGQTLDYRVRIDGETWDARDTIPLRMEIRYMSPDYVLFEQSYGDNINTVENPYTNPAQVYSNIEGGVGIIAGYRREFIYLD